MYNLCRCHFNCVLRLTVNASFLRRFLFDVHARYYFNPERKPTLPPLRLPPVTSSRDATVHNNEAVLRAFTFLPTSVRDRQAETV